MVDYFHFCLFEYKMVLFQLVMIYLYIQKKYINYLNDLIYFLSLEFQILFSLFLLFLLLFLFLLNIKLPLFLYYLHHYFQWFCFINAIFIQFN